MVPEEIARPHQLAVRDGTPEDLTYLHARIATYATSTVALAERMKIARKNPSCFRVVEDIRDEGTCRKMVGVLASYPLDQASAEKIRAGEMTGANIRADLVLGSFRNAAALYVSFAEGTPDARSRLMAELLHVVALVKNRPLLIAGIPTTDPALKIMTKRGFTCLDGAPPALGKVCIFDLV